MTKILGISAFYHDSAAALVVNGQIVVAAQEERFTRVKHVPDFPVSSIKYCLEESGLSLDELDAVVFYDKPFLKFERLLETYYAFAPRGIVSFLKAIPIWLKEKLIFKKHIFDGLAAVEDFDRKKINLLFTEHHIAHAASSFFCSPFEESAILTIDGVGEWNTSTIGIGRENYVELKQELNFPHSVGLLYSSFTYFLGFKVNSGEYKLMGLAPYGIPESNETLRFVQLIKTNLVDIKSDGSIWLDQSFFNYATGLTMINEKKWEKIFAFARRHPESEIEQRHCNLAYAIQSITEEIVIKMARQAKKITRSENLCLAGGVALNCVANSKLMSEGIFKNIFVQPAAGDAGASIGAALAVNYMYFGGRRITDKIAEQFFDPYLGPDYSMKQVELMNRKTKANAHRYDDFNDICVFIAQKIKNGSAVGWFQGRMEFGPRSLGNRSILADPRRPEMQLNLNLKIKKREGFRPFAPSVLSEDAKEYFELSTPSPYMTFVAKVSKIRHEHSDNYASSKPLHKLYKQRSDIPSVTHVDYTARVQTVHKNTNKRYWKLIKEFKDQTGCSVLINTSFNVRGEPIVCTPEDAFKCFMKTELDYLVINNYIYNKKEQSESSIKGKWEALNELD